MLATADNVKDFFNGKDLTGWDGDPKLWQVENGEIVGKSPGIKQNEFLQEPHDRRRLPSDAQVKLTPDKENSGVQFRSEALPDGEVKGPQADVGAGWWGKLYEENGRGILWDKSGEEHVKTGRLERLRDRRRGQPDPHVHQRQAVRRSGRSERAATRHLRLADPLGRTDGSALQGHSIGASAAGCTGSAAKSACMNRQYLWRHVFNVPALHGHVENVPPQSACRR